MAGAILFVSATSDAEAFAVKRTPQGELVHWEEQTVAYKLDPSLDRDIADAASAASSAMASWSGTVGAPLLQATTATLPTKPGVDETNGIFYAKNGYAAAGRALAITVLTYDNTSGRIVDADVVVNGKYRFEVLAAPDEDVLVRSDTTVPSTSTDGVSHEGEIAPRVQGAIYDLHHVIAHELGHSLGMNDELGRKDALMYRYSPPNDATLRNPGADDIAGLAEIYSAKLEAHGNGCGSASIAPTRPTSSASHVAMFATLGLLAFLVLRARKDKRARAAAVAACVAATIAMLPSLSGKGNEGVAHAAMTATGHARARVLATTTTMEDGLFKTSYRLATRECHAVTCPKSGHGAAWGGTIGNLTQEVGGHYAPSGGDEVDVSFTALPNALGSLSKPLAGLPTADTDVDVAVLTAAR